MGQAKRIQQIKFSDQKLCRFIHLAKFICKNITDKEAEMAYERSKNKWIKL